MSDVWIVAVWVLLSINVHLLIEYVCVCSWLSVLNLTFSVMGNLWLSIYVLTFKLIAKTEEINLKPTETIVAAFNKCNLHVKEGRVLFNDALNTFYLWLCGIEHKDHSDSERRNLLLPLHGLLFLISSKGFLYAPSHRHDSTYHNLYFPALAGTRNSSVDPPWEIDPMTHHSTELHLTPSYMLKTYLSCVCYCLTPKSRCILDTDMSLNIYITW